MCGWMFRKKEHVRVNAYVDMHMPHGRSVQRGHAPSRQRLPHVQTLDPKLLTVRGRSRCLHAPRVYVKLHASSSPAYR